MLFNSRVTAEDVRRATKLAGEKFPGRLLIVLHDGVAAISGDTMIDVRTMSVEDFRKLDLAKLVFVYACSEHFNGGSFARYLIANKSPFIPAWTFGPARYTDQNAIAHRVLEAEWESQNREGFAKWDSGPGDFINLCQALEVTRNRRGAFLEIGCFRGSSGSVAVHFMKEAGINRDAYFFDVFDGFAYDAAIKSADAVWANTHATDGIEAVNARLKRNEEPDRGLRVHVMRHNIVEEPVPASIREIAVANIDVDLYEAVLVALHKIAPLIVPGGIMIVEDPGHTPALVGARVALDEFLETVSATSFVAIHMESGQTFLIRTCE